MEYQLKYYKEIESKGMVWRVEIHHYTDSAVTPMEIGAVLQGLRLIVQGDQADIDTPIVKTSMEMIFVDAPDLDAERKCGYWEEFYTSSSTEYQVILFKNGVKEWTGYITPDSFSESLQYRGSVTIIARDNLGTLQDITFDMSALRNLEGKVKIQELVQLAIGKSKCQLDYIYKEKELPYSVGISDAYWTDGNTLLGQYVDTNALTERSWWDALYDVLYSSGLVLRYLGQNKLQLMALRSIPLLGNVYWADVEERNVIFSAYGHRELLPAVKSIKEIDEFDIDLEPVNEIIPEYMNDPDLIACENLVFTGTTTTTNPFNTPVYGYKDPAKPQYISPISSNILNVGAYPRLEGEDSEAYGNWDDKSIIYYAVNAVDPKPVRFYKSIQAESGKVSIRFVVDKPVSLLSDFSAVLNTPIVRASEYGTAPFLQYRLLHTTDSKTLYYDANVTAWKTGATNNTVALTSGLFSADVPQPVVFELTDIAVPGVGVVTLEIIDIRINIAILTLRHDCIGMYMRLRDIAIETSLPEDIKILHKVTLTTEYSDKYAVRIDKNPAFAVCPSMLPEVAYVPNAILTKCKDRYRSPEQWNWSSKNTTGISLSRLIHQQLLAYYAMPNNVLTGEIVTDNPTFNALYRWNGKQHILTSGSLNVISGHMENAVLRQFYRYDHMWEVWVEQDAVEVDSSAQDIKLVLHTNRVIRRTEIANLPNWITFVSMTNPTEGLVTLTLSVSQNDSGIRTAYISIATAIVKINQL